MSPEAGKAITADAIKKILEKDGCTEENYEDCYPGDLKAYLMSKTPAEIFGGYKAGFAGMLDMDTFAMLFADGAVISSLGKAALNNPETYNQVPTILGTNKEEWKLFMFNRYGKMPDADYQAAAMARSMAWKRAGVDVLAAAMSANKGQPAIYAYQFDYGAYNEGGYNAWPTAVPNPAGGTTNFAIMIGAAHVLEIPFFFGNWVYLVAPKLIFREDNKAGREALSKAMVGYLSAFAHTGTPSYPNGVVWKPWSNKQGEAKRIIFDANATQALIQMSNE
jgi:para-nitrobenzyl esterase